MKQNNMMTRRDFIRISCSFPVALAVEPKDLFRFTEEVREELMGTFVVIKAVGAEPGLLKKALSHMRSFEAKFSRFDPESSLSALNRDGVVRRPPSEFVGLLKVAAQNYRETDGVFDPTVLPVLLCLESTRRPMSRPEIERCREAVGFSRIVIYDDMVYVTNKATKITLDGLATGYIVDRGVEFLKAHGCMEALVNVGGDIHCGKKAGGWKTGVYDPLTNKLRRRVTLESASICTSGSYVNYYSHDRSLHHLIDPRTLTCPGELVSATAISRTTARADMLSTSLFIAGAPGKRFLLPGERAYLITKEGRQIKL